MRGFTTSELKHACFTARELKQSDLTASELKQAGFTTSELKQAGFTLAKLKQANELEFKDELERAGVAIEEVDVAVRMLTSTRPSSLQAMNAVRPSLTFTPQHERRRSAVCAGGGKEEEGEACPPARSAVCAVEYWSAACASGGECRQPS